MTAATLLAATLAAAAWAAQETSGEADPPIEATVLFDDDSAGESDRDRDVSRAVDTLADRFGHGTVMPGRIVGASPGRRESPETGATAPAPSPRDPRKK